jgi:hypothetical protein
MTLFFQSLARTLVKKGSEILFPSRTWCEAIKPWYMHVQVRELENRVLIAAPNICDGNSRIYKAQGQGIKYLRLYND